MTTIISALISAAVTLAVCLITQRVQSIKDRTVIEMELKSLQKAVDKHNTLVERMYEVEQRAEVQDEKIKNINRRINDMAKD